MAEMNFNTFDKDIVILLNTQAVIKTLINCRIKLKLVLDVNLTAHMLGKNNTIKIWWISAHEKADILAKAGAAAPKAYCGISNIIINEFLRT